MKRIHWSHNLRQCFSKSCYPFMVGQWVLLHGRAAWFLPSLMLLRSNGLITFILQNVACWFIFIVQWLGFLRWGLSSGLVSNSKFSSQLLKYWIPVMNHHTQLLYAHLNHWLPLCSLPQSQGPHIRYDTMQTRVWPGRLQGLKIFIVSFKVPVCICE